MQLERNNIAAHINSTDREHLREQNQISHGTVVAREVLRRPNGGQTVVLGTRLRGFLDFARRREWLAVRQVPDLEIVVGGYGEQSLDISTPGSARYNGLVFERRCDRVSCGRVPDS